MLFELLIIVVIIAVGYYKRDFLKMQAKKILSRPDKDIEYLIEESKSKLKTQFDKLYELKAINECLKEDLPKLGEGSAEYVATNKRIEEQQKLIEKSELILKEARTRVISFEEKKSSLQLRQGVLDIREQLFGFTSSLDTDNLMGRISSYEQNIRVQEKKMELMEQDNV